MILPESSAGKSALGVFLAFSIILLASLTLAIYFQNPYYLAFPLLAILVGIVLTDYTILYYLLLIAIPFSMEVDLPYGLGTDLFSEPLLIILAFCMLGSWLLGKKPELNFIRHPLMILLLVIFCWSVATTMVSQNFCGP